MKENYVEIYNDIIGIYKSEIEEKNIRIHKKRITTMVSFAIVTILVTIITYFIVDSQMLSTLNPFFDNENSKGIIFFIGLYMFGAFPVIIYAHYMQKIKNITKEYKSKVITKLVENVYKEKVTIDTEKGIPEKEYNSKLFEDSYNMFISKDLIKIENSNLLFSELLIQMYMYTGKNRTEITIFQGVAGKKLLNKNIGITLAVLNNKIFLNNKVKLDSSEFEKYFDVKSDDKLYATRFLTADIMQAIIDIKLKYNCNFEFGIENNILNFRIATNKDFFEVPNYNKGLTKQYVKENFDILYNIKVIIDLIEKVVNEVER